MNNESKIIFKLIEKIYSFVKNQENWFEQLPKSYSEEFNHSKYGSVTFTMTLSSKQSQERFYLNFRITIGKSYTESWITFGDRAKVVNDIMMFYIDQSPIENSLPDRYMGLLDYP